MNETTDTSIDYLIVLPYNANYVKYYVNDSQKPHSKKLENMEAFLLDMLPLGKLKVIHDLLFGFVPFMVDISKGIIEELKVDEENLMKTLRAEMKSEENFRKNVEDYVKEKGNKKGFGTNDMYRAMSKSKFDVDIKP